MNILGRNYIKSSGKLRVVREKNKIVIENNSDIKQKLIFYKSIKTDNKRLTINSVSNINTEENCTIKILNRKFRVIQSVDMNTKSFFSNLPKKVFIGLSILPNAKIEIDSLEVSFEKEDASINEYFSGNILLICPGYPMVKNKYLFSFIHSRVQAYKENKLNVDVAVVHSEYIEKTEFATFENVDYIRTGYNQIRNLLQVKKYDKILIHFFDPAYFQLLEPQDLSNTQIILYSHGTDALYRAFDVIGRPYFVSDYVVPESFTKTFALRDYYIKKYNNLPNVKFVFVSNWAKKMSEELLKIKYNNAEVIPCFIDEKQFPYTEKDPELRKRVFVLRKFDDLSTYSIDIDVRVILELSHRKCFNDMEFSIYGDGGIHDKLVEPLRKFSNVHIYRKFLSHDEIKMMQKENGIGLFATRFDTQAVSSCEAAMAGCVVVSSKNVGTCEYIDPKIGTFCETENIIEYADLIEELYNDPKLFKTMSEKMHDSVMKTCSYKYSIKKDMDMILSFDKTEKIKVPDIKKNPILSIVIPSYNVGKYIKGGVKSLLRSKYASDLEIIIVNDGSKDDTVAKSNELLINYRGKNPIIKIIDKENGGHGSTINKGIEIATGKYFRLMDGDDYYITENLDKLLEKLKDEDSDIVLTNYIEDFAVTAVYNPTKFYPNLVPGVQYNLDEMYYNGNEYGFIMFGPLLPTSTYKTSILKNANFKIDEHCFYVDMEYNLVGYINAKTVSYYPFDIYNYYLGRQGQSISKESYRKNILHHEKVCLRLVDYYTEKEKELSESKKAYLNNCIIVPMCKRQYELITEMFKNNEHFISFDRKLKKYPQFYNNTSIAGRRVKIHRLTNGHFIWMNDVFIKLGKLIRR